MGVELAKQAIDLGIVIQDSERSLAFYRDVLGLEHVMDSEIPGGKMHRMACGETVVKLVLLNRVPETSNPAGGLAGATGYRYFTMIVSNLAEIMAEWEEAGVKVAVPITEVRPGTTIGMVEDPDGNWVEFVENT